MSPMAGYLVETFVTLGIVAALAVGLLIGARRMGLGRPMGPMQLIGRLPLDARRSVYLVRVADQVLVVGVSEAGLTKLAEVDAQAVSRASVPQPTPNFLQVLSAWRERGAKRGERST